MRFRRERAAAAARGVRRAAPRRRGRGGRFLRGGGSGPRVLASRPRGGGAAAAATRRARDPGGRASQRERPSGSRGAAGPSRPRGARRRPEKVGTWGGACGRALASGSSVWPDLGLPAAAWPGPLGRVAWPGGPLEPGNGFQHWGGSGSPGSPASSLSPTFQVLPPSRRFPGARGRRVPCRPRRVPRGRVTGLGAVTSGFGGSLRRAREPHRPLRHLPFGATLARLVSWAL